MMEVFSDGSADAEVREIIRPRKRKSFQMSMSPRVMMTRLDLSPATLELLRSTPEATEVAPTPAPRKTSETLGEPETAAWKRTAPTPSPRRSVAPEMLAPAASPLAEDVGNTSPLACEANPPTPNPPANVPQDQACLYERLAEKLEELDKRLERSEAENARLRAELELYRTGIRTVVQLEDSVAGVCLGSQATTKSGPSKRTLRRQAQRERALARQSQGPAQQRMLELQEQLRREIAEEQGQKQQQQSYRDAGIRMAGGGKAAKGPAFSRTPAAATAATSGSDPAPRSGRPAGHTSTTRRHFGRPSSGGLLRADVPARPDVSGTTGRSAVYPHWKADTEGESPDAAGAGRGLRGVVSTHPGRTGRVGYCKGPDRDGGGGPQECGQPDGGGDHPGGAKRGTRERASGGLDKDVGESRRNKASTSASTAGGGRCYSEQKPSAHRLLLLPAGEGPQAGSGKAPLLPVSGEGAFGG
uniref:Uncharacterized protein n=1 Tax=Anopheles funestus TaxID=62324 RepID=A0A4Y0BLM8_ANOFN